MIKILSLLGAEVDNLDCVIWQGKWQISLSIREGRCGKWQIHDMSNSEGLKMWKIKVAGVITLL